MKKTLMSVVMASVLVSGSAFADDAKKEFSNATINFDGNVTASLCQIADDSLDQTIHLGDATVAQVSAEKAGKKSFNVRLVNCDTTVNNVDYIIQDANGKGSAAYLVNSAPTGFAAENVGVYIETHDGTPIDTDKTNTVQLVPGVEQYNIGLTAHMGPALDSANGNAALTPTAGQVSAKAIMLVKAYAKP